MQSDDPELKGLQAYTHRALHERAFAGWHLEWSKALINEHTGVDWLVAITVPMTSPKERTASRTLVGYYHRAEGKFKIYVFEIRAQWFNSNNIQTTIKLLNAEGVAVSGATYLNGQFSSYIEPLSGGGVSVQGYWDCVMWCLRNMWPTLPGWLKFTCEAACGACIFGGNPLGCSACVGCLAGYAAGCLWGCY